MIRFRNPSSSIETILASFDIIYKNLRDKDFFDNNDIAQVLAKSNLMASSGFVGVTALSLGANTDRSRDRTYNNAKMFAEIFRLLGLISIVNNTSSNYRFTFIGDHLVLPSADKKLIIEQCVLGLNNPNMIMDVSYDEEVRFFSCVLLTMDCLDGYISRDEMILGPMCVCDNSPQFMKMISYIKEMRGNYTKLQNELKKLASSLTNNKKEGMTVVSIQNCTRFPISVLKFCGWVRIENKNIYGKSIRFMQLTPQGKKVVEFLKQVKDIRLSDYNEYSNEEKNAIIRLGVYSMLERSNFDIAPLKSTIDNDNIVCNKILSGKEILFSPFQTLDYSTVNKALNIIEEGDKQFVQDSTCASENCKKFNNIGDINLFLDEHTTIAEQTIEAHKQYVHTVYDVFKKTLTVEDTVKYIMDCHKNDKKTEFYPFVATLFNIIGVKCQKSRDGVNGERWDAMIVDAEKSIPIEIKSPTEELHISVKAIRQALENKIVLLSRKTYNTDSEVSSFAVGYLPPNNRAEVLSLIKDIKYTYGYKIAVFSIKTLIHITVNIIIYGKGIDLRALESVEGIVDVKDVRN